MTDNENKTCYWCFWHNWHNDKCSKTGAIICGNGLDRVCSSYTTAEDWFKEHLKNGN